MATLQDVKHKLEWSREHGSWVSLTPEDCGLLLEELGEVQPSVHPAQLAIVGSTVSGPFKQPDTLHANDEIDFGGGYPV